MVAEILFVLLTFAILVLPLLGEASELVKSLPGQEQLRRFFEDLVVYLRTLPEPTQEFIRDGLRQAAVQVRDNLSTYFCQATDVGINTLFSLIRTFSFVVGLLVLPTWLYSVMADQNRAVGALDSALPALARADL